MSFSIPPPSDVPQSRLFEGWGHTMQILRWPVLFACWALTSFMAHHSLSGLVVDTGSEAFLPQGSDAQLALSDLRREFGALRSVRILAAGDVFSSGFLERLAALHQALEGLEEADPSMEFRDPFAPAPQLGDDWGRSAVVSVSSLVNFGRLRSTAAGIAFGADPPETRAELARWRDAVLADPHLVGKVVDPEGEHAILNVELSGLSLDALRPSLERIADVVHAHDSRGFALRTGGSLVIQAAVHDGVMADQDFLLSAESVALLLMMWIVFRHPMGVFGPLFVVGQAATCMFGWMALTGVHLSMISAVLGALVLCTGMAFSVHLQAAYRRCRAEGFVNQRAVVRAVASTGAPVLFTTLISCAAMLSFLFANMEPIRTWGLAAAAGIFFSGLFTLTFLPAWLSLNERSRLGMPRGVPGRSLLTRVLAALNRLSRRSVWRRWLVLVLGLLSAVAFVYYGARVRVRHDPASWLPADLPAVVATGELGKEAGGSRLNLLIEPVGERDSLDPEVMQGLRRLSSAALAFQASTGAKLVRGTRGLPQLLDDADTALELPREPGFVRSTEHANDLVMLWERVAPDALRRYLSLDRKRTRILLQVGVGDVESYAALSRYLKKTAERDLAGIAEVRLAGHAYNTFTVVRALFGDLLRSFAAALVVVSVLLLLLFRDVRLAFIALVSTVWPFLGMLGFMGLRGLSLDIQSVLLAAIAMGLGVDNAIHFLHFFRVHHAGYGDVNQAVAHAFEQKGPAMLGTSFVLAVGFAVLMLGYMSNTRSFGLLALLVVGLGLLSNLVFMPALLRSLFRSRPRAYDPQRASSYDLSVSEFS